MKRVSIILAVLMVITMMAACTQPDPGNTTAPSTKPADSTSPPEEPSASVTTEEVTFTVYTDDGSWMADSWGIDPVSQIIKEKTNVNLQILMPAGDTQEKLNLMVTTGDIPDMLHIQQDLQIIPRMIDGNLILSIDDLAAKYNSANILSTIAEDEKVVYQFHRYKDGSFYQPDGKIYYISNYQLSKRYYDVVAKDEIGNPAYMVRKSIWDALGNPSIETPEDMHGVLKQVKDGDYKDLNGNPVIPMAIGTNANQVEGILMGSFGIPGEYYVADYSVESPDITHFSLHPRYLEMITYYNMLWREGLIEPETFTMKSEQMSEKLNAGGYFLRPWGWFMLRDASTALTAVDPEDRYIAAMPMKAAGVPVCYGSIVGGPGRTGWMATMITSKVTDEQRAISFLDYLMSKEGQMLTVFGPDGLGYTYDDQMRVDWIPEQRVEFEKDQIAWWRKTGIKVWYFVPLMYYHREGNNPEVYQNPLDAIPDNQAENEVAVNAAKVYRPYSLDNLTPPVGDPLVSVKANIDKIYTDAKPQMLTASSEAEVKQIYDKMVADMKASGLDQLEAFWESRFGPVNALYLESLKEIPWFVPTPDFGK